jgi:hypothetical protein
MPTQSRVGAKTTYVKYPKIKKGAFITWLLATTGVSTVFSRLHQLKL